MHSAGGWTVPIPLSELELAMKTVVGS